VRNGSIALPSIPVARSLILFSVPVAMIVGAWWRGTRPEERRAAVWIAIVLGITGLASFVWAEQTAGRVARGSAYALVAMFAASVALLIRSRPGDDGPPPAETIEEEPPPFDWDEFEREFWREVDRRERPRVPS
jgi:hypothetical protein